jgi:hypothetical protein
MEISMWGMVWSARELFYGFVLRLSPIDAGDESPANGYMVRWTRIAVVVAEMEGEGISHGLMCAIFESRGRRSGNKFVRTGLMVL